jgi:predicted amidohydrolase YtcJ
LAGSLGRKMTGSLHGLWAALAVLSATGFVDAAAVPGTSAAEDTAPDLILLHGRIHTEDAGRSVAQALAVRGNTIIAVGTDQSVAALKGPGTRSIDLKGRVVLPGIIDAHTHPAESAQDQGKCSLGDKMLGVADIKAGVAACLRRQPAGQKRWLEVVQVNPSGVTFSAGIGAATRDPAGGRIGHDHSGKPTGTLRDVAAEIAMRAKPAPGLDFETSQLDKALAGMRAIGITSVQDADADDHDMQLYRRLYEAHRLKMRVRATFGLKDTHRPADAMIADAIAFRTKWQVDPDFLRADAVKIFADGVIEYPSQTAALLAPYLDGAGHPTDNRGPTYFAQDHLNRIVSAADAAGFTVHVHAIGDRAVRSALDAFADARQHNGMLDNRDQIAHLELVDPADFPRFKELGVIANFQLLWAESDPYITKATVPYLGPDRSRHLYPARSLRDAGALIVGGSDWGVSTFNPFAAMEHAITRRETRGREPLLPEQSIGLQDVIDAYTVNAAFALKQEHTTGSLEQGKRADLIVLDRDIFAIEPFGLHDTRVLATYLDGREVHATPDWGP